MPIPADNVSWPPAPWDFAYRTYAENEAWYIGDTDALEKLYTRERQAKAATHTHNGQAMRGGLVGAASRMFWGRPVPAGETRTRLHVPAAADLATLSSDLIFAEPPDVQLTKGTNGVSEKTQTRLDLIANSEDAHATFNTMGELKAALGATVITSTWDTSVRDNVWLQVSAADVVMPVFRNGVMVECTMWTEYADGQTRYRHLEHHAVGMIEHALFRGTENNLGKRVPLADRPETAALALLVNADSRILTGIDRLTASYNLNMPTRSWRKKGALAYTGRSDFANLHGLFDALDETFSSWMRDLKQGAGRILVPEAALDFMGPGMGATFDMGREVFAGLNTPGRPGEKIIDTVQFEIRVEQHERTAFALYREILRAAGYSQSAWGDYSGSGAAGTQTATEVDDRNKASERTRDKKILYDKAAIARQASVALELDGRLFSGKGGGRYDQPTVVFPDVSQEDPEKLARTLSLLDAAGAISTWQKVVRQNPDWDEPAIKEEVARIQAERNQREIDPSTFTGDEDSDDAEVTE